MVKVDKGDSLFLTEAPDGYRVTSFHAAFEQQMEGARKVMHKRRAVLRELAK
jgi:hypothetical protein